MPTRSPDTREAGTILFFFSKTVTGPGRNFLINPLSLSLTYTRVSIILNPDTAIEIGLSFFLPLIENTFSRASSEKRFAPIPYTVSVG
ncbi:Uncharacterised protein [uncultured archaeon]|nr:Uncharacterised protein [uncultured archaeon]